MSDYQESPFGLLTEVAWPSNALEFGEVNDYGIDTAAASWGDYPTRIADRVIGATGGNPNQVFYGSGDSYLAGAWQLDIRVAPTPSGRVFTGVTSGAVLDMTGKTPIQMTYTDGLGAAGKAADWRDLATNSVVDTGSCANIAARTVYKMFELTEDPVFGTSMLIWLSAEFPRELVDIADPGDPPFYQCQSLQDSVGPDLPSPEWVIFESVTVSS